MDTPKHAAVQRLEGLELTQWNKQRRSVIRCSYSASLVVRIKTQVREPVFGFSDRDAAVRTGRYRSVFPSCSAVTAGLFSLFCIIFRIIY